jgi:hypothetical protein
VPVIDADLGRVDRTVRTAAGVVYPSEERLTWHRMLTWIAKERGYNPKWPRANYKEKFGAWPPYGSVVEPTPPSPEVLSWVRSRMIAYAKRRSAA